jgi:hypothetical protein
MIENFDATKDALPQIKARIKYTLDYLDNTLNESTLVVNRDDVEEAYSQLQDTIQEWCQVWTPASVDFKDKLTHAIKEQLSKNAERDALFKKQAEERYHRLRSLYDIVAPAIESIGLEISLIPVNGEYPKEFTISNPAHTKGKNITIISGNAMLYDKQTRLTFTNSDRALEWLIGNIPTLIK